MTDLSLQIFQTLQPTISQHTFPKYVLNQQVATRRLHSAENKNKQDYYLHAETFSSYQRASFVFLFHVLCSSPPLSPSPELLSSPSLPLLSTFASPSPYLLPLFTTPILLSLPFSPLPICSRCLPREMAKETVTGLGLAFYTTI